MKRLYLPLILFLFLVLEGVAIDLFPESMMRSDYMFVPHWLLVFLAYIAVFYDRDSTYISVMYAVLFGLLFDIVYTGVLGLYMFSYGLVIYIVHGLKKMLHANFFVMVLLGLAGIVFADAGIYIILTVVEIAEMPWQMYIVNRLLPTLLLNLLFLILLYPIFTKRLISWGTEQLSRSNNL